MVTFETLYRSLRWDGPMVIQYGWKEGYVSWCEWIVPGSEKVSAELRAQAAP